MRELSDRVSTDSALIDVGSVEAIKERLVSYLIHTVGVDPEFAVARDWLYATASLVRGILSEQYLNTARVEYDQDVRRVYYLSLEFLTGRSLMKNLWSLGLVERVREALKSLDQELDEVAEVEFDAALGNGGLGRLAACFLDSLATHAYPGFGYGIRYEFGMFNQKIENGQQVEHPETWLRYGNPWEFERPAILFPVRFGGHITCFKEESGKTVCHWVDTEDVMAMAYDVPVSGFGSGVVTKLRLWSARATRDFDLDVFNAGSYIDAVKDKTISENLSKVLYPADTTLMGQELRLKQEYFFVSASLQDILARHLRRHHDNLDDLHEKVAIQLNDTHPALAVPELMRLLIDVHGYEFDQAWDITRQTFSYTNHTLLPEALETWSISMLESILPRHLDLIYQINHRFLTEVKRHFPGRPDILGRLSLVDDKARQIRMAHLAVVGSHKVNGVAELHTHLMRQHVFADFAGMMGEKFVNVTNGITQRRWLLQSNTQLAGLISEAIGTDWVTDLSQLHRLEPQATDSAFCERMQAIKRANKERLAALVEARTGVVLDPAAMFDAQVKRIHEYKRQLLNLLHVIVLYNRIKDGNPPAHPRAVLIAGKSAPGYYMAKLIIRLIHDVADVVNNDPAIEDRLKLVFIPNYNVSTAEVVIPGSDLSEQISTAGMEASGTGNMKFALNGALTIGTLDGANIEIKDAVGDENIFICGLTAEEVAEKRTLGYHPWDFYNGNADLKRAVDQIGGGFFCPDDPGRYQPVVDNLLRNGDHYFVMADFASYAETQARVEAAYGDPEAWTRMAVLNVANMGMFSSDRSIHTYAKDIWRIKPLKQA
ncbi:glycogen/starch/alpha-glucan phosphorylase [Roseospirillum parvum]|uniref:Alpha-1,4 glucan phosphorylase n=1 Tax=Roseospirillum parvum TaxID=83401 RepID=A0A1G7VC54_9PROT|nr:glycogen/starch/alpha-glucan phosphorylase [Roseospirillum parvum]SDG56540.1 starch phosphorylase [Roseospirillum parvum]